MNKTAWFPFLFIIVCLAACDRKPYVEHKLKFEKVSDDCRDQQAYFRMVSNFGGERYEFEKCLPADFSKDQLVSERKGDTVLVRFTKAEAAKAGKVYHLTLDIDSYPRYHYITIDGDTYAITSTEK
jgi:hypothetical protein